MVKKAAADAARASTIKHFDHNKLACCFNIYMKDDAVSASTMKHFYHSKLVCCFCITIKAVTVSVSTNVTLTLQTLIDHNKLVCCFHITTKDDAVRASTIKPIDHTKLVCCIHFLITITADAIKALTVKLFFTIS
jgi:hypothetical protein